MQTLTQSATSAKTTANQTLSSLSEVMSLHKLRAALYAQIAVNTDDSLLKNFFQRMAASSRRFRTELNLFAQNQTGAINKKVMKRIEKVWNKAVGYLQENNMVGLLEAWNSIEEIMIDAYLKVASNTGVRGNFRKIILKQIDSLRKDRNVYRFVESIFLQKLAA